MATLWDILGKAASILQLLGLDAITVITVMTSFLLSPQDKTPCQKLERRVQALRELLQRPAGCWIAIQHSEMGDFVGRAIEEADALVESYKKSSLWSSLRRGRSMAGQFSDMQNAIESYCMLVLSIDAFLLIMQLRTSMWLAPCNCNLLKACFNWRYRIQVNDASGGVLAATGPDIRGLSIGQQEGICSETDSTDDSTHNAKFDKI